MSRTQKQRAIPPVRKTVAVNAPPEQAFRRFTEEMATWWPLRSHSVDEEAAETVAMETRLGGRIVERIRGGRESVWGTITAWDPPRRVAFTWHPGRGPATYQDVEVRFSGQGDRTRVDLVHSGFERLGPLARKARLGYPLGWTYVLGLYARRGGLIMGVLRVFTVLLLAVAGRRQRRATAADRTENGIVPADA